MRRSFHHHHPVFVRVQTKASPAKANVSLTRADDNLWGFKSRLFGALANLLHESQRPEADAINIRHNVTSVINCYLTCKHNLCFQETIRDIEISLSLTDDRVGNENYYQRWHEENNNDESQLKESSWIFLLANPCTVITNQPKYPTGQRVMNNAAACLLHDCDGKLQIGTNTNTMRLMRSYFTILLL